MSLVKCPECGKEISDTAHSCPNCGFYIDKMKFCKFCGEKISDDCVVCPKCGRQVEDLNKTGNVFINNSASSSASAAASASANVINQQSKKRKNKWVAFFLCLFLGYIGAHKFYEGKIGMGILYLCTCGLFVVGIIIDLLTLFSKSNPYYV